MTGHPQRKVQEPEQQPEALLRREHRTAQDGDAETEEPQDH
jgi:hypothetical protein